MASVFAELSEKGDAINVHFRYDKSIKDAIKAIPGSRFVPPDKGGPYWRLTKEIESARRLRENLGNRVEWGEAVLNWGRESVREERKLRSISILDDVPLEDLRISEKLPALAEWLRPYQRADVKFLSQTSALNLLEQRLGKTPEIIGSIYESGLEERAHLVVTPSKTSIDDVWDYEFRRWTDLPVFGWSGDFTQTERSYMLDEIVELIKGKQGFVFVTTPNMVRSGLPEPLIDLKWGTFTVDEFHKTGLAEFKNKFPQAAQRIKVELKWALSGTPIGGRPIKFWGGLNFLWPDLFTSKWRWAGQWLEVEEKVVVTGRNPITGQLATRRVKEIGDVQPGREQAFYEHLSTYSVRRLREEVLPQLPPVQWVDVPCTMTPKQKRQYLTFARETEIRIDEHYLSATSILAEYTRLKQFADSYCEVESYDAESGKIKLRHTPESGKLEPLMVRLAEAGIDPNEPYGEAQAIVASQHREFVDMVYDYLAEKGIKCAKITGKVNKRGERSRIVKNFKHGQGHEGMRVLCMTTDAGGVALTLDNVESVHIMDEKWNPDDQTQLADRAVNTSTLKQVTAFVYRAKETIEVDSIQATTTAKGKINKKVLDEIRQAHKRRAMK